MFEEIRKIIRDPESVLVFDFDGTLVAYEFGEHNHGLKDWGKTPRTEETALEPYRHARVLGTMQEGIIGLNKPGRIYVCSRTSGGNEAEKEIKTEICMKEFKIPKENVMFTETKEGKLDALREIHGKYPGLPEEKIVMVDDDEGILDHILENSGYTTIHISSFME